MKYHKPHTSQKSPQLPQFSLVVMILLALLITGFLTGCQPGESPTPTDAELVPSDSPIIPTDTSVPPTDVIPTPTNTVAPPPPKPSASFVTANTVISVRSGPGLTYAAYKLMLEGQTANLVGVSPDGEWWALQVPGVPLELGWVYGVNVHVASSKEPQVIQPPPVPPTLVFSFLSSESDSPYVRFRETVYANSGPGNEYPAYGVIQQGQEARAASKTEDGSWYQVVVPSNLVPTNQAWVPAQFVEIRRASMIYPGVPQPAPQKAAMPSPDADSSPGYPMTPVYLRSGPGNEYPVYAAAPHSNPVAIVAFSPNREWLLVRVPSTVSMDETAWMAATFVYTDEVGDLEIIEPSPLPVEIPGFEPGSGDSWARPLENIFVFTGPGNTYASPGYLPANQKAVLSGISREGDWLIVRVPKTVIESGHGWIRADLVETLIQSSLPVIEPPPK